MSNWNHVDAVISLVLMLRVRVSHVLVTGKVVTRRMTKIPVFMLFVDCTASDTVYTNITFYTCTYTHDVFAYIGIYYIHVYIIHAMYTYGI